ncbi:cysteine-rich protein 1 isoform X2 [Hyalella azteca]|uniref:Cysteine-rich protein 1 isoform X2 n=1 Tax=Hyalella azteca TaxID=294128 RepID=A0A8B7NNN9_HYAAZ|nr:cysteine-rich protein 1 isoform X2 [Hyalella azteca]
MDVTSSPRLPGTELSVEPTDDHDAWVQLSRGTEEKFGQYCSTARIIIMVNCPACEKPVYFAERKTSLGKDWHGFCLKCAHCKKTLNPGAHAEHEGKPYCNTPCYGTLFGPGGYGRGGTQSFKYDQPK